MNPPEMEALDVDDSTAAVFVPSAHAPPQFPFFVNPEVPFVPRSVADLRPSVHPNSGYQEEEEEACFDRADEDEERRRRADVEARGRMTRAVDGSRGSLKRKRGAGPKVVAPPPRPDAAARAKAGLGPPPNQTEKTFQMPTRREGGSGGVGKRRGGGRTRGVRGERTYRQGVERFCHVLLRWPVGGLVEHDPAAAGLAPLPSPVSTYEDAAHYFGVHQAVATEEARATLARAIARGRSGKGNPRVRMRVVSAAEESGLGLVASKAKAVQSPGAFRGGHRGGGGDAERRAPQKRNATQREHDWRRPGTVLLVRGVGRDAACTPVLAIVVGKSPSGDGGEDSDVVPLWSATPLVPWTDLPAGNDRSGRVVEGEVLDSVISQQRMAASAHSRPWVPFLPLLLGAKRATHTKFGSSSSDSSSDKDEDAGSEYVSCEEALSDEEGGEREEADSEGREGSTHGPVRDGDERNGGWLGALNPSQRRAATRFINACWTGPSSSDGNPDDDVAHDDAHDRLRERTTASPGGVLRDALQLVQGPPGCGKTRFVAALLHALVSNQPHSSGRRAQGRRPRVLVCAPSNKAVTVALEQYLNAGTRNDAARYGPTPLLVGVEDALEAVCTKDSDGGDGGTDVMEYFVYRRMGVLADRVATAAGRLRDRTVGRLLNARGAGENCLGWFETGAEIEIQMMVHMNGGFCSTDDLRSLVRVNHTESCAAASAAAVAAARALMGLTETVIAELEVSAPSFLSLQGLHASLQQTVKWSQRIEKFFENPVYPCKLRTFLSDRQSEMVATIAACCRSASAAEMALRSGAGRGEYSEHYASEAISRSSLVFCTLVTSGQAAMSALGTPDALVVDEAAQCLEAELVVAFARRPRRCLLVGDPAQLPATMASDVARGAGHDRSLMSRLMNQSESHAGNWYTLLDTQYRMHPAISEFPSRRFYQGKVRDAFCVKAMTLPTPDGANCGDWIRGPFVFVDVASGAEERGGGGGDGVASISNEKEAELAAALAVLLPTIVMGTPALSGAPTSSIITFYSEQVKQIQCQLSNRNRFNSLVNRALESAAPSTSPGVHTVDSFQGSEADVVVVSAVRANANGNVGFLADKRRLNVALTRAKRLCVFLGCAKTLSGVAPLRSTTSSTFHQCPLYTLTMRHVHLPVPSVLNPDFDL